MLDHIALELSQSTWSRKGSPEWIGQRDLLRDPIEHVWDMLQVRVRARQNPPITARELETALMEEWNLIPQQQI